MSEPNLHELRSCAEDACQAALEMKYQISGMINWGDLGCVDARHWTNCYGLQGLTVCIEEASPHAHELQSFIREYLADNGWKDVEVVTEW
jgi:hypothetical protein